MKTQKLALMALFLGLMPLAISATTTSASSTIITDPSINNETNLNAKLLENSKAAQAIIDKQNEGKPVMEINHLSGLKSSTQVDPNNLTDQDKQLSENYVHQGKANAIIEADCAGDMATVCQGNAGDHKFMGMNPAMVKAIAQAYALFGSMADFGSVNKGKSASKDGAKEADAGADAGADTAGKDGAKGSEKKEKANDYCKYIPTATEGIATAVQAATSNELKAEEVGNGDTAQKDALLKAAKSHDSRAKMAQIQAAGWFGGGACYAVGAATGKFATDKNLVIKIGAAALLGSFYQSEVSANKEYAEKTRAIAEKLPGKGDCNPITDKLCYCSQPSTENDPTYCLPGLHKKAIGYGSYRIACTTDKLQLDPTCACEASNSCFEKFLENQGAYDLQLGLGHSISPFSPIRSLARGELVGGTVNNKSYDQTSAIAKRALKELAAKLPANGQPLTPAQKALADAFLSRGIPSNVAAYMAQGQVSQAELNSATARLGGAGFRMASVAPLNRNSVIVDFSGGNGFGFKGNAKKTTNEFAGIKPGAKGAVSPKIMEFAQKAEEQARNSGQIRGQNDRPLFEIISLRYQISGRKLLEVDTSN
jgi:hypothetical protein